MNYMNRYNEWLHSTYIDKVDQDELRIIGSQPDEIQDRFYKDLAFGTGGLRGVIGIGTNRINKYTVRKSTQGLANFLLENEDNAQNRGVAIAYDSRHCSDLFALEAALVLAANGIRAYLFDGLRSTPELSFTVRHLGCCGGIVITASHNPPEYNGYKVYNADGGQITLDHAQGVIAAIQDIQDWSDIQWMPQSDALNTDKLIMIGEDVDSAYIDAVVKLTRAHRMADETSTLNVVYTPLHGTGLMPIRAALDALGYQQIHIVQQQATPDGQFPTVKSPNPEEHDAFTLGIAEGERLKADIIIGTDPDCDRVGVVVKNADDQYQILTGNQTGALLVDYMMRSTKGVTASHTIIKTIVTSELGARIAESHGASVLNTLTGFKFIGEKIKEFEQSGSHQFLMGYEESYGYLAGTFVRDKDAVIASTLIVEMMAYHKSQGHTLYDALKNLYAEHGYYLDHLETFIFRGADGQNDMQAIMTQCRDYHSLLKQFPGSSTIEDYQMQKCIHGDDIHPMDHLPVSDVIKIHFNNGSWIAIRPSGTEPKLKAYYSVRGASQAIARQTLDAMQQAIQALVKLD